MPKGTGDFKKVAENTGKIRQVKVEIPARVYTEMRNAIAKEHTTVSGFILSAIKDKIAAQRKLSLEREALALAKDAVARGDNDAYAFHAARLAELQRNNPRYKGDKL